MSLGANKESKEKTWTKKGSVEEGGCGDGKGATYYT